MKAVFVLFDSLNRHMLAPMAARACRRRTSTGWRTAR